MVLLEDSSLHMGKGIDRLRENYPISYLFEFFHEGYSDKLGIKDKFSFLRNVYDNIHDRAVRIISKYVYLICSIYLDFTGCW